MSKKYTSVFAGIFRALEEDLDADIKLLDNLAERREWPVGEAACDQAKYSEINARIDTINAQFQSGPVLPKV